ncbi:MotA/TolQ/ExbB proton channel family protein [Methylophaga thiooxydans]|uniref:Transporter, MotA/TolQ/ExbB proton channel family protein n=2 Tax=Methylophaga thiooxydans TaxID=392484 RepID=C0N6U3_9GAMM|nr:MotA/TolQ/ExbB proton channel family protein [Methylophaga thiooxydans]EEF79563.1 transporter, MotA/TolQ/ExbB proton channel family protein [Methylophaga thiooxydans DMS010]KGM07308.1 MotA/TolQ/ExbB proton channel family protein [Methylophaga thiooxydans]
MLELFKAGGWLMIPLFICSVISIAIIAERFWSLQQKRIAPPELVTQIWQWLKYKQVDASRIKALQANSPLGQILASGLINRNSSREITKESIEDIGRHVTVALERNLNTLGTVAAISPLIGLLGTVIGMIKVFAVITAEGVGNPETLAGGISEALITTATGLVVAIPSLIFYRYFRGKISKLVVGMEEQAMQLIEILHGDRQFDPDEEVRRESITTTV